VLRGAPYAAPHKPVILPGQCKSRRSRSGSRASVASLFNLGKIHCHEVRELRLASYLLTAAKKLATLVKIPTDFDASRHPPGYQSAKEHHDV